MKKRLYSIILATLLVASVFTACGKEAAVAPTNAAPVESAPVATTEAAALTLEAYLSNPSDKDYMEESFQLSEAIAQFSDTYSAISLGAEGNDLYMDYFFTEEAVPADAEEAYKTALADSLNGIEAATFASIYQATEELTGISPEHLGFRYFAASGNELGRVTYSAAEINQ